MENNEKIIIESKIKMYAKKIFIGPGVKNTGSSENLINKQKKHLKNVWNDKY